MVAIPDKNKNITEPMVATAKKKKITDNPKIKKTKMQNDVIIIEETDKCENGVVSKEESGNTDKPMAAIPEKNVKITKKIKKTKINKSNFKTIKNNRRILKCGFCEKFNTTLKSKLISHMVRHKKDFLSQSMP